MFEHRIGKPKKAEVFFVEQAMFSQAYPWQGKELFFSPMGNLLISTNSQNIEL